MDLDTIVEELTDRLERIEDRLEFYDGSNQLIWTIRRTIKFGDYSGEYQYKDKNGVWQILPQISFLDDSNQINTNNRFNRID